MSGNANGFPARELAQNTDLLAITKRNIMPALLTLGFDGCNLTRDERAVTVRQKLSYGRKTYLWKLPSGVTVARMHLGRCVK